MTSLPNVMISYHQKDSKEQMIKLKDRLKLEGFNVWIDIEQIEGNLGICICSALEKADVVIACISEGYQKSDMCHREFEYAFNHKHIQIIPVKVNAKFYPSGWLDFLLGGSFYYKFDNDDTFNENFPKLLGALKHIKPANAATVEEQPVKTEVPSTPVKYFKPRKIHALDCTICLGRFRNPKALPCLHSFCKECLLGCAPYGTKTISCPLCRKEATIPDGDVNKLQSNFVLRELVEEEALQTQEKSSDSSKFICTCCGNKPVIGICQTYNYLLCGFGLEAHQKFPDLNKHNFFSFDDIKDTSLLPAVDSEEKTSNPSAGKDLSKTNWDIFDAFYNEDYSSNLMKYWMQQGEGWRIAMVQQYIAGLDELEEDVAVDKDVLAKKQQKVARVFMQAGKYKEALTLVKKATELEFKQLGKRLEQLADLYGLAAAIHCEITKMTDFIHPKDEADLSKHEEAIGSADKSCTLREFLKEDDHMFQLGKTLVILAFSLDGWSKIGGDIALTKERAEEDAKKHIGKAIEIFKTLDSKGNLADAIMTKGLLCEIGSPEQKELYMEAYRLCIQAYGEYSILTMRLCCNIGAMYEDRKELYDACGWYFEAEELCVKIYGKDHEKTHKLRRILKESKYADLIETFTGCDKEKESDPDDSRGEESVKKFQPKALFNSKSIEVQLADSDTNLDCGMPAK